MGHHLFDPVQPVVVADPVDQRGQLAVGGVEFARVSRDGVVETGGCRPDIVIEMYWAAE